MRVSVLIVLSVVCGASALGAQTIKPIRADRLANIVANAPTPPDAALDLGLTLRLIDYIDCTRADDPHDFRDQGTSRVVTGPAGTYRTTPGHDHAFFSYGYRTQGRDKPVLLVIEYPDDGERRFSFMTHDSMRPAQAHVSFTPEGGVYTGRLALPNTNTLQTFTLIHWPQDDWSPLLVVNYGHRPESAGVASRIWVYAIDAFDDLDALAPDPTQPRRLGLFGCLGFLMKRDNFGWHSPRSIEHLVDYCKMVGVNQICAMMVANQGWGGMVTVPAWDIPDDKGNMDSVLQQLDRKGGVEFICGIVAEGMYGDMKSGGQLLRDMPRAQLETVLLQGFDQIIDRYGHYRSFKGFALGSMEASGFYELLARQNLVESVVTHIKTRRPDFRVQTFLGTTYLQTPFFMARTDKGRGRDYPTPSEWDMVRTWETTGGDWQRHLVDQVAGNWTTWQTDPRAMAAVSGLSVYEQQQPDDHRIYPAYRNQPRSWLYYDLAHAPYKSERVGSRYGAIFGFFDEGWLGLTKDYNFWYSKWWTAPDFNGSGALALDPWATHMGHRDRLGLMAGSWTMKTFGLEVPLRRFAQAYRRLPPTVLTDVDTGTLDVVTVRWTRYQGKRYVNLINRIPFALTLKVDEQAVTLSPFGMQTQVDTGLQAPKISGQVPSAYRDFVQQRLLRFTERCDAVASCDPEAVPGVYRQLHSDAVSLFEQGRIRHADWHLAYGLEDELRLRQRILQPPSIPVPRLTRPQDLTDPETWSSQAHVVSVDDGSGLESHIYFPNSWSGPQDLSFTLTLGHDSKDLLFCIEVKDSTLGPQDGCSIWLSSERYRNWRASPSDSRPEITWSFKLPSGTPSVQAKTGAASYTAIKTDQGYRIGGHASLRQLGLKPQARMGFLVNVVDDDGEPSVDRRKSWAKKQVMHYPHDPTWALWQDVRNAGEMIVE